MTNSSSAPERAAAAAAAAAAADAEGNIYFLLADSGKPVVSSGEFGSSEDQAIQTDCLLTVGCGSMSEQKTQQDIAASRVSLFGNS